MTKRKRKTTAVVRHRRRSTHKPAVRRRRRKSSGLGAGMKAPLMNTLNAGIGGGIYGVAMPMVSSSPMTRGLIGLAASFLLGWFNFPVMGNGMAGAATSELVRGGLGLNDDDLEEADYTDVDLSDKELAVDENGNVYALGDDGDMPVYVGNVNDGSFDLSANGYDLSDYNGEQSVMMSPTYAI